MTQVRVADDHARQVHEAAIVILTHGHEMFPDDFERMRRGGVSSAFVVISVDGRMYAPRDVWLDSLENDTGLLAGTLVALDYVHSLSAPPDARVLVALEPHDIEQAKRDGKVALILGCEGTRFLEGRLEVLRAVYRLGFRYVAPMWFYDCAAGAAQDNGADEGLTEWGRALITEANRLGLLIDANHFSERSLREALELSRHPLLISHSGARALNPEARQLLPDPLLKELGEAGGVVGMMFQSAIIKPGFEEATLDHLVRQFAYCAELIGTDHIACGPDYLYNDPRLWGGNNPTGASPGPITWARGVEDAEKLPTLTAALLRHGFTEEDVTKMLGANVLRLFATVRHDAPVVASGGYERVGLEIGVETGGLTPV